MCPRFLLFICLLFVHYSAHAQSKRASTEKSLFTITAGLNTNVAYDMVFSYHYMLSRHVGVGGGIGYFKQWYNDILPYGEAGGKWISWMLNKEDRKIGKVYLQPSVLLSSPTFFDIGKYTVSLTGELGVQMLIPYSGVYIDYINSNTHDSKLKYKSTHKGDFYFWNARGGVSLKAHSSALTIGYGISNLDIYASRRTINIENTPFSDFYPNKKRTHSLFVSLGYFF